MKELNTISEANKQLLKRYLEHYDKRLEEQPNFYDLSDEFINYEDMRKFHIGMQFIIGQMLHELNSIKTFQEQREIDAKWGLLQNKPFNGED